MKIPIAIKRYCEEYEEEAREVREYLLRQIGYYETISDKSHATVDQWIGFKLGCSSARAAAAIRWAQESQK